jgi:hypothetical protein
MFSQFFGNYLFKRRIITSDQLRDVLALQDSIRVKIGVLTIDAGYMTAAQVDRVNELQKQRDKRFGEIAIEEGYLDEDQLSELLGQQNKRHLLISQALIDKGILTFGEIERIFGEYKQASGLSSDEFEALKRNDLDAVAATLARMPDMGDSNIYAEYFSLFARNLVRFVDGAIFIEPAERVKARAFECFIHQEIDGRFKFFTGFAGPAEAMAGFAARFAKMDIPAMDDLARDSLGEFMNIHNGLFLSKLSNDWVELELLPPEYREYGALHSVGAVYRIPFGLSFGSFEFFIGLGSPVFK